jgi:hypothetical protein
MSMAATLVSSRHLVHVQSMVALLTRLDMHGGRIAPLMGGLALVGGP